MSLGFIIVSQMAVAQWRFTVSLSTSGCGNSMDEKIAWKAAEAQVNYWMGEGYVTFQSKSECEQSRTFVMSQSFNQGNCKIRYIASPCTGSGGASGSVDVLGISKGSSFYSTNSVNEIKDWSEDDMERQLALYPEYNIVVPKAMETGDIDYDEARQNERNKFGTPSYSGNNYTGYRYNTNRATAFNASKQIVLEEQFVIQDTKDFIRTAKYQELPSMSTESFIEYCNQITKDAEHIRNLAPEVNYQLYCSETIENDQKVQNVFIEYIIPKNTEVSILEDPFVEQNSKLQVIGDSPILTEESRKLNEESEKNVLEEQIKKLEEEIEEIERARRQEEYEASFAKRMIDELEKNQLEESYYIARNLYDLGVNQIPLDVAGTAGEVSGKSLGMIIENQFEQEREEAGIPKEPENKVADFISEIREVPGLGDLAKKYLGKTVGWFIVNAPEIGKSFGHGMAKLNIYFQQREWKNKAELHTEKAYKWNREAEIKNKELRELRELQEKNKQHEK